MNLFQIHKATGEIIIAQEIDRDSGEIKDNNGVCEIIIQVCPKLKVPYLVSWSFDKSERNTV